MSAIDYEKESASRSNWLDITGGTEVTLLDEFAGKAMQGMIGVLPKTVKDADLAEAAYTIAEAMLAERAKRNGARSGQWHEVRGVTGKTYG